MISEISYKGLKDYILNNYNSILEEVDVDVDEDVLERFLADEELLLEFIIHIYTKEVVEGYLNSPEAKDTYKYTSQIMEVVNSPSEYGVYYYIIPKTRATEWIGIYKVYPNAFFHPLISYIMYANNPSKEEYWSGVVIQEFTKHLSDGFRSTIKFNPDDLTIITTKNVHGGSYCNVYTAYLLVPERVKQNSSFTIRSFAYEKYFEENNIVRFPYNE